MTSNYFLLSADSARQARHLGHVKDTQVKLSSVHCQVVIMLGQARAVREEQSLKAISDADGAATVPQLSSEVHHHASYPAI